jgi:hypothetical protein
MARIVTIDPQSSTGKAKTLLDAVQSKMKMVPNLMRVLASSRRIGGIPQLQRGAEPRLAWRQTARTYFCRSG